VQLNIVVLKYLNFLAEISPGKTFFLLKKLDRVLVRPIWVRQFPLVIRVYWHPYLCCPFKKARHELVAFLLLMKLYKICSV
jgi:hypothetical protein